ncbi:MAG: undecaprenyl-diphosphatase UppP [Deferribacteres bacterium]|nr:undecaprenyl-diphosphatase UppP [candidate division KSB1 bacterium]MCB9503411.1 undecaprenyl-diphosphatase UppP [Deferribacteres bacterium]
MSILQAIILGLVQGLTEFLPVSSSGHLTLGKAVLGITEQGILFEVVVHLGTLFAVLSAFRQDVIWLLNGLLSLLQRGKQFSEADPSKEEALRYVAFIIWATIPAVAVGLFFKDRIEQAFSDPLLAAYLLLVTGVILLLSRFGLRSKGEMNFKRSLIMGVSQAFAILPGISRSGSTISMGMLFGVNRTEAARFSFLMALPAIGGAFVLQLKDLSGTPMASEMIAPLVVGFIVSYVSGLFAIKVLMSVVKKGRFDYFAWYCFAVGIIGIYFLQFA